MSVDKNTHEEVSTIIYLPLFLIGFYENMS